MLSIWQYIRQDYQANKSTSLKSRLVLGLFRAAQYCGQRPFPISQVRFLYQLLVEWLFCIELPWDTQVGPGLQLQHGFALVVNHGTTIGANCILRHSTTIGNKIQADGTVTGCPKLGDGVEVGANVVILGPVCIGKQAVIGAGSVVVKDIPAYAIVAGNPAKVLRYRTDRSVLTSTQEEQKQPTLTS